MYGEEGGGGGGAGAEDLRAAAALERNQIVERCVISTVVSSPYHHSQTFTSDMKSQPASCSLSLYHQIDCFYYN